MINQNALASIGLVRDTAALLLSGFSPGMDLALSLVKIVTEANRAHMEQFGKPIDPSLIQPIEKLTEADLPAKKGKKKESAEVGPEGDTGTGQ